MTEPKPGDQPASATAPNDATHGPSARAASDASKERVEIDLADLGATERKALEDWLEGKGPDPWEWKRARRGFSYVKLSAAVAGGILLAVAIIAAVVWLPAAYRQYQRDRMVADVSACTGALSGDPERAEQQLAECIARASGER